MRLAFVLAIATALAEAVVVYIFAVLTGGSEAADELTPLGDAIALLPSAAAWALGVTLASL
jgi:hypothetical protein